MEEHKNHSKGPPNYENLEHGTSDIVVAQSKLEANTRGPDIVSIRDKEIHGCKFTLIRRIEIEGQMGSHQGEFLCPVSRRLANAVLPDLPKEAMKCSRQLRVDRKFESDSDLGVVKVFGHVDVADTWTTVRWVDVNISP
ncbi:hypothetical protein Tco_0370170 [Tanacetum coccineum]